MAGVITVDDADPRIQYSNGWYTGGQPNLEYDGTTHGTEKEGVTATFTFAGSSVSVYGTVSPISWSPISPTSTYSIDGSAPIIFNPGTPSSATLFNQLFYQSPLLKDGEHTLVITCNAVNSFFWLDYIQFKPMINTPPPMTPSTVIVTSINQTITSITSSSSSSSSSVMTSSTTTKSENTVGHPTSEKTSTTFDSNSSGTQTRADRTSPSSLGTSDSPSGTSPPLLASNSSKTPTGAIVGAVIGGIIFLIIVSFLIWRCRRRTRGQIKNNPIISDAGHWNGQQRMTGITPFNVLEASNRRPTQFQENRPASKSMLPVDPSFGYTIRGATPSGKRDLYGVRPSHSQSQSMSSSSTGLIYTRQDPGEESSFSPYVIGPSYVRASHIHEDLPRGHGVHFLHRKLVEDTPPAYQGIDPRMETT